MIRLLAIAVFIPCSALAQQVAINDAPVQREIALTCTFTTECLDTDGCSDTAYSVTIEGRAGGETEADMVVEARLISDAATVDVIGILSGDVLRLNAYDARMPQLLISTPDGARLTSHITSVPLAITYAGTCE